MDPAIQDITARELIHLLTGIGLTAGMVVVPAIVMLVWMHTGLRMKFSLLRSSLAFVMGVLCVVPVAAVILPFKSMGGNFAYPFLDTVFRAFGSAAFLEETFKLLATVSFVIMTKAYKRPITLIVYAATVSLGFATFENLMYVVDEGLGTAVVRALTAVPCHGCLGAISGYYLGRYYLEKKYLNLAKAWAVPVLLHGMYDLPLMVGLMSGAPTSTRGTVLLAMLTLCLLILWTRYVVSSVRIRMRS